MYFCRICCYIFISIILENALCPLGYAGGSGCVFIEKHLFEGPSHCAKGDDVIATPLFDVTK